MYVNNIPINKLWSTTLHYSYFHLLLFTYMYKLVDNIYIYLNLFRQGNT